jgi:hypothetical protein
LHAPLLPEDSLTMLTRAHDQSLSWARGIQLTLRFSVFMVCCDILKTEAAYSSETLVPV